MFALGGPWGAVPGGFGPPPHWPSGIRPPPHAPFAPPPHAPFAPHPHQPRARARGFLFEANAEFAKKRGGRSFAEFFRSKAMWISR